MTAITTGVVVGSIYALIAIGYNVTYVAASVLNFAYAHFVILGAFLSLWLTELGAPYVVVLLAGALVVGIIGLVEERFAIRPLSGGESHAELITTVGVGTILTGGMILIWGSEPLRVPSPLPADPIEMVGARIQSVDIVIVAMTVVIAVGLHALTRWTRLGLAALAQAEDREAAMLRGINVKRLSVMSFALAAALAGLVGPLVGVKTFAVSTLTLVLAIKGFVVLNLGGLGSIPGALLAGVIIGVLENLAARYVGASFRDLVVFVVFLGVLLFRPQGMFGRRVVRTV